MAELNSTNASRLLRLTGWFLPVLAALFVSSALWPGKVLETQARDLAVHVRHTHEYNLALREGQYPPLAAPSLNESSRIPLFQYYSGTGYTVPGLLCRAGFDAYLALRIAIVLSSFLGAVAVNRTCRLLGFDAFAALTAAAAFQLFPFSGIDLLNRGAYIQWLSLQVLPVTLWLSLRVVYADTRRAAWTAVGVASVAWAYFVPIHPIQTLYAGGPFAALVLWHCRVATGSWRAVGWCALPYVFGTLAAAWYWLPILRDWGHIQNYAHQGLANDGFTWGTVLAPYYVPSPRIMRGWAVQVGAHFALAAVAVLLSSRPAPRRVAWLAAALFVLCLLTLVELYRLEPVRALLRPLQSSYRLLVLVALLGALCVGQFLHTLKTTAPARLGLAARGLFLVFVIGSSLTYFRPAVVGVAGANYHMTVEEVLAPTFISENSEQYAMYGTDYRRLPWLSGDRLLANRDHRMPWEGVPYEFRVQVRSARDLRDLKFLINGEPQLLMVRRTDSGDWSVHGLVRPLCGLNRETQIGRFEAPEDELRVSDFVARPVGEKQEWTRIAPNAARPNPARPREYWVHVEPAKAGLYQMPVRYFSGLSISVNDQPVTPTSADTAMVIVPLKEGANVIRIATRPSRAGLLLLAGVVGCWLAGFYRLSRRNEVISPRLASVDEDSREGGLARAA